MVRSLLISILLLLAGPSLRAQFGSISGKIFDKESGETLIGATVVIVGTYKGASSDLDGNYSLDEVKAGDYSVKFSYIGYSDVVVNGVRVKKGQKAKVDAKLPLRSTTIQEVVVVGDASMINLEKASSEVSIDKEEISQMNVRNVQDIISMQAGVNQTPDGVNIRGARNYETQYIVDGISAQDPLSGTGFGVEVSAGSIGDLSLITGGAGAEFGGGAGGVISTKIREGGKKLEVSGSWIRDNFAVNENEGTAWNTDIAEFSLGGPVPFTKKKVTFFSSVNMRLSDDYYRIYADQVHSSLFPKNDSLWAPRQNNKWSHTLKLAYEIRPGTKLSFTNQHSLAINQNTRSLQVVGFDAVVQPGLQYRFSLQPDNATAYTHHSNLSVLNFSHFFNNNLNLSISMGRLFTNLRADANGRPFRDETVDQIYDPRSLVTSPVQLFNPNDPYIFVIPGEGLYNNDGLSTLWHDHFAEEYTFKGKVAFYPNNEVHEFIAGVEHKELEYQWSDVARPWVGAPIQLSETESTPSISIGSSSEIWNVKPRNGGIFIQDKISYKSINATLGLRYNYWAYGGLIDDAVEDPNTPIIDNVREEYREGTTKLFGQRYNGRILPRVNVSFPVTDNNVLFFNYSHAMQMPHPRFLYAGLDPDFLDRSFLSTVGNPILKPEATVSYEIGIKTQITRDLGVTLTAYNNDKYDYIIPGTINIRDQTGRFAQKTFYFNQDYARIIGVELGIAQRVGKFFLLRFNGSYQSATGKSNSAREGLLQLKAQGFVNTTKEQPLSWDRPWDLKLALMFNGDSTLNIGKIPLNYFHAFFSMNYKSGFRYTPVEFTGTNDLGRNVYEYRNDRPNEKIAKPWFWADFRISRDFFFRKNQGFSASIEVKNVFNNKNAFTVNPVTGDGYREGDDVPITWRDPKINDPQPPSGAPPTNPARWMAPRQILYGIQFKF